jgi:hypothetical protein
MHRWFKIPLLVCVLAAGAIPCKAKLGEKIGSCASSYGRQLLQKGFSDPDGEYHFQKKDYVTSVLVLKGVVVSEIIRKSGKSAFTEKEKGAILQKEGGKWTKDPRRSNKTVESWYRDDGSCATYSVEVSSFWLSAGFSKWPLSN